SEAQLAWARERVQALTARGHVAELLDIRAARSLEPALSPALPAAVHYPQRAQADPGKATRAFAAAAERLGAVVLAGRAVTGLARDGDAWRVDTAGGALHADALVLAAG